MQIRYEVDATIYEIRNMKQEIEKEKRKMMHDEFCKKKLVESATAG